MERIPKIHGRQTLDQVSAPTLIEAQMPDGGRQTMKFQALLQDRPAILAFLKEINFQGSPLPLLHRIAACDKPMVQDLYNREEVYGLPPFFLDKEVKCINSVLLCRLLITNPVALGKVLAQLGRQTLDQVSAPTLIEAQMPDGGRQTMEFQALLQNRPAILAFLKEINFQGSPLPLLHRIAACDKPMVQDLYNREEVYGLPPFFMGPKGKGCVNAVLLCQLLITNPGALGEVIAQLGR